MPNDEVNNALRELRDDQIVQKTMLAQLCGDTREIKEVLIGEDKRSGMVIDVDRLKRVANVAKALFWLLITTTVGTVGTIAVSFLVSYLKT